MYVKLFVTVASFILLDIITGLTGAIKNGTYKSSVMRQGLFHKLGEFLAVAFSYGCEYAFPIVGIDISIPIAQTVLVYIIIMETGSIIENISTISPEVKIALDKAFKRYSEPYQDTDGKHIKGDE